MLLESSTDNEPPIHVALVADPQIVDNYSYGQTGLLLRTVEFFTDIYLRKSYTALQQLRQPAATIFLGDMFDGGREWGDAQWLEEYYRYNSIFRNRHPKEMRVYNMAGNHDIGIGNTVVPHALDRFRQYIGPLNRVLRIGPHQIILLDTLTLESDDPRVSNSSRRLVEWLRDSQHHDMPRSRLLFTHVPMWRPDNTDCGPLRQSKLRSLHNRRGYQFRDQLFENTTNYLLDAIQPDAVFSGDDHDTCTVEHHIPLNGKKVTEYTIGAFGWASGVPIASYGLLTLHSSVANAAKDTLPFDLQNCYLPYQLGIYKCYGFAFVLTLLAIVFFCQKAPRRMSIRQLYSDDGLISDHVQSQLPLPAAITPTFTQSHGARPGITKRVVYVTKEVAIVAIPAYVAFIVLFYII
ncbi:hypothetical protein H4R20_000141 [Coemansia guatemalensis]|uniref:Calcineurin-like phosphoesterase domain-containing protein n=1 Tax=Coemansia guatemalensis TaxID=2761395 RepID=A0A9W8I4G7_9FUNG|nr:hypothetical protein H4R20_000141 [Coemansia guatemalensis]